MIRKIIFPFLLMIGAMVHGQTPITDIQGKQALSPYAGKTVTVKGIVTASKTAAAGYFIQDDEGAWSGMYIYDPKRATTPVPGDEVELTGLVSEYFELTEISNLTKFEILSSGNAIPEPIAITTGTDMEPYESVLVKVSNAACTKVSMGYGEWEVNDGTGPLVINDFFYAFTPTAGVSYDIVGPLDYSFSLYKIEPRSADDITINAPVYFTTVPYQKNISKTAITVAWETNVEASGKLQYGKTELFELGEVETDGLSTNHEITLIGLESGELYYVKAFSVLAADSTPFERKAFTTISNSSGAIRVAFTNPDYQKWVGDDMPPEYSEYHSYNIADTIVAYINLAKESLDIAIYDVLNHASFSDNTNQKIFDAIKDKAIAGIRVRLITDDTSSDPFFTELLQKANVMWGNTDAIMHHKFMVIDAQSELESWVVTGSVNWTYNNLVMDANNLIAIQDRSLAKAYTAEFNEMWGGSQNEPNYSLGKFGSQKKNNTPHLFEIGRSKVELYFSPSDKTESKIIEAIENAHHEIIFSMMVFTSDGIGQALLNAHKRGVKVKGVIDYVEYSGSEFEPLQTAGIDVLDYINYSGESWPNDITIHHKFMVVDYLHSDSDPTVITGTHNWSASAESRNDENTLVIHNENLAKIYAMEAELIYNFSQKANSKETVKSDFSVYPNPASQQLFVTGQQNLSSYSIFNRKGQVVQNGKFKLGENATLDVSGLTNDLYLIRVLSEKGVAQSVRFIKK